MLLLLAPVGLFSLHFGFESAIFDFSELVKCFLIVHLSLLVLHHLDTLGVLAVLGLQTLARCVAVVREIPQQELLLADLFLFLLELGLARHFIFNQRLHIESIVHLVQVGSFDLLTFL